MQRFLVIFLVATSINFVSSYANTENKVNNTVHITEQLPEDIKKREELKQLFYEPDRSMGKSKKKVFNKFIREYGAQEMIVLTKDGFRISAFSLKNSKACCNIIFVPGYFHDQTPTKEWAANLAFLFSHSDDKDSKTFNTYSFDWRSFGSSDGKNGKWLPGDFGLNAYPDIQAVVDHVKKDNDKPIVLMGFCAGAAMAMYATLQAQQNGDTVVDALILDSIFEEFKNQFDRAILAEDRWYRKILIKLLASLAPTYLNFILNGSLFDLRPVEMIKQINMPCLFLHYTKDPFATLSEAKKVVESAKSETFTITSDIGRHARTLTYVPCQCRKAICDNLKQLNIIKD